MGAKISTMALKYLAAGGVSALALMVGLTVALAPGESQAKPPKFAKAAIPFEAERAANRGDSAKVQLNDDATLLPGHRVRGLPIINGRMGEHIQLDGVTIYMPFGRVISATAQFRPDGKSTGKTATDTSYALVSKFDSVLGPVCASDNDGGSPVQMRINADKAMSLVKVTGGSAEKPDYQVETSLETRYFRDASLAGRLAKECKSFRAASAKN